MKRRNFIKGGTSVMALGTVSPQSFSNVISPEVKKMSIEKMDRYLVELDRTMNRISAYPTIGKSKFYSSNKILSNKDIEFITMCSRTLLLTGNFGELSTEEQVHPGVQERLKYSAQEMSATINKAMANLTSLQSDDYTKIKSILNNEPEVGDMALDILVQLSREANVPKRRSRQLNAIGKKVLKRLKHSPEMFINESLTKCSKKMNTQLGYDDDTIKLLEARLGKDEADKKIEEILAADQYWGDLKHKAIPIGFEVEHSIKTIQGKPDPKEKKALKSLGIGALITATGWLLVAIGSAAAMDFLMVVGVIAGITIGPLIIIIALITLLVLASKKSKEQPKK
jgi:hypothetical protein